MVFGCVWAMCALCVILFIRGAHPHVERPSASPRDDQRGPGDIAALGAIPVRGQERSNG
jgi:hypothetical protein